MQYIIQALESKTTSTGKNKYDATLTNDQGIVSDKITIWDSFPDFANLKVGMSINADIVVKQNGQYTNKTAYPTKTYSQWKGSPKGTGSPMGAVMKQKEASIEKAQDNKAYGIMVASTASMATEILTSMIGKDEKPVDWKENWLKIRYWLVKNWENLEQPKVGTTDLDYPQNNEDEVAF